MIHDKSVFMNDLKASHKIIHCTIIAFMTILLLWEELAMQSTTTAAVACYHSLHSTCRVYISVLCLILCVGNGLRLPNEQRAS